MVTYRWRTHSDFTWYRGHIPICLANNYLEKRQTVTTRSRKRCIEKKVWH